MAPRKSTSRSTRVEQPVASARTTSRHLPSISLPDSITPNFKRQKLERRVLDDDERGVLIHELLGLYPRKICDEIMENARQSVYDTVGQIEAWAQSKTGSLSDEYRLEVDIGLHSLETLLESHVDKAFDKFTAWALRNPFDVPSDLEFVLPWLKDLDFERGQHIAAQPNGEQGVLAELDDLRRKVEQSRYTSQQLERAERLLDKRLEIARQRKAEVGFVKEAVGAAGLQPLQTKAASYQSSLSSLQTILSTMDHPHPSLPPPTTSTTGTGTNLKAWELGRQAYLSWAVGRAVGIHQTEAGAGAEEMDDMEKEAEGMGGVEGVEGMMKAINRK